MDEDKTRPKVPSSYSSVVQPKAKEALASLDSEHMSRREELLRLEEEIKLKLRVLEAEHEVLKGELQGKWSKGEGPALTELPDTFHQPYWLNGTRRKESLASMPKTLSFELVNRSQNRGSTQMLVNLKVCHFLPPLLLLTMFLEILCGLNNSWKRWQ